MPGFHARLQNARKLQPNRCCTRNSEYVVIWKASVHSISNLLSHLQTSTKHRPKVQVFVDYIILYSYDILYKFVRRIYECFPLYLEGLP